MKDNIVLHSKQEKKNRQKKLKNKEPPAWTRIEPVNNITLSTELPRIETIEISQLQMYQPNLWRHDNSRRHFRIYDTAQEKN